MNRHRGFRDLPLFWKLLLPFLALMVILGTSGVFLIVRDLASRADATLQQDLARRSLEAHSFLRERELFLLESSNLAANLEGMAAAIERGDERAAARLLQSVMALKPDLDLVIVTDRSGAAFAGFSRDGVAPQPVAVARTNWSVHEPVRRALADGTGGKHAGFVSGARTYLVIAAPVCATGETCAPVGAAIAAIDAGDLATRGGRERTGGIALYDRVGGLLSASGPVVGRLPRQGSGRAEGKAGGIDVTSLFSPLEVQGREVGMLEVGVPKAPVLSAVRGAAIRLVVIVFLAMVGVVIVGTALSRTILRQVSALLETNRAIGRGNLGARAPVESRDELGELATGVNQMAEQLQASYETLEFRVAERTEEVQRLLKERTEFFASLSHELRTPLAVILGEVKLMRDRGDEGPSWVRDAERRLGQSAEQLLSLVNEVLDLARTETGRLEMRPERLEVPRVIEELRPTLEGLARSGDLALRVQLPANLPPVKADPARLRDIVLNLFDNAVKYTPHGGTVQLSAAARNGSVQIAVSDNGVGIPPESHPFLFEPFYRVPGILPQHGRPSSGLGLSLAKRLAEAHGGTLAVESAPDVGSTFTLTLPRAEIARGRRRN